MSEDPTQSEGGALDRFLRLRASLMEEPDEDVFLSHHLLLARHPGDGEVRAKRHLTFSEVGGPGVAIASTRAEHPAVGRERQIDGRSGDGRATFEFGESPRDVGQVGLISGPAACRQTGQYDQRGRPRHEGSSSPRHRLSFRCDRIYAPRHSSGG